MQEKQEQNVSGARGGCLAAAGHPSGLWLALKEKVFSGSILCYTALERFGRGSAPVLPLAVQAVSSVARRRSKRKASSGEATIGVAASSASPKVRMCG